MKQTLSVILVEDEIQSRDLLIDYISSRPDLSLRGIAKDGAEALEKISSENFDLVFLDIDLPIMSGLEVLEKLERIPYIIFITAIGSHALKAFELGALDYLKKPITRERFTQSLDRAVTRIRKSEEEEKPLNNAGLLVTEKENHFLVPFHEIIYITSHEKHSVIHTEKRDFETPRLLHEVEKKLPGQFLRIHKQTIINIRYISHIQYLIGGRYQVFLKDSDETNLTAGRKYADILKKTLDHR